MENYLKRELYDLMKKDDSIFDFIQESSLDGLWYWDLEQIENEWLNARFWTILGYNPDEMPHKSSSWQNIINQDDLKIAHENFNKHIENPNHPYDQIVRYTHKNGSIVWVRCRGMAIRDKDGKPIRMLGAHHDLTDIKNAEQELIKAKEKAEESDRLKTAFLQNLSHEIRTPMNAIMGFSELLVKSYNNKPKLEKFSEIINQRCNDLLNIINDILDIARIESGQLPVNMEECNLNVLFAELQSFFTEHQKKIDKQHLTFNLEAHCESSDTLIVTDKVKLKQIFINLISNAFKFTDTGKIEGGCHYDENNHLVFFVSDTGIGIPPDKQEIIFERFAQVDHGLNRLYGGTGLGLSIVKGLINLLGGEILLESECGKGSKFSFVVPYKKTPVLQYKTFALDEPQEFFFGNKTILIVEDDIYNAEYLKEILSEKGVNIIHTIYGKDSVEIATTQPVDLVLMDIRLPDIDGYESTCQIIKQKPTLKIIAQTAYASPEERQKAMDSGCVDYISKPTRGELLMELINKHLT